MIFKTDALLDEQEMLEGYHIHEVKPKEKRNNMR
jgi:hypothetical protein